MLAFCLLLGFLSWLLPTFTLIFKRRPRFTALSLTLCAASLYCAIYNTNLLVRKGDWAAIEDTFPGVLFGATVLVAVTAVLNLAAGIAILRKKKADKAQKAE